ncbi:MAG: helix-turn-helix domain-containing protein, partial [Streptosporangiaceae bacterium]
MSIALLGLSEQPWREVPAEEAQWMRPHLPRLLDEMVEGIRIHVPEYARPGDATYLRVVRLAVEYAMEHFVKIIADPDSSWKEVQQVYFDVGYGEAVEGRSLEHLQNAMRLGSRVAWRNLAIEAERLGRPYSMISILAEANFAYLDQLSSAAAHGYSRAREKAAGEREHRRGRLLSLLLSDPPASAEVIAEQAVLADWPLPARIAVVLLQPRVGTGGDGPAGLPPHLLSGVERGGPCLVMPDPDGPSRISQLTLHLAGWTGAVGPSVPIEQAGVSLSWARRALALLDAGTITPLPGPRRAAQLVRAEDHLPSLLLQEAGTLAGPLAAKRLAPLHKAGPQQGLRLAETLLECMKNGFNATGAANALCVHPQTVRYRLA